MDAARRARRFRGIRTWIGIRPTTFSSASHWTTAPSILLTAIRPRAPQAQMRNARPPQAKDKPTPTRRFSLRKARTASIRSCCRAICSRRPARWTRVSTIRSTDFNACSIGADIADYIDAGFGTVPSAIILSAQPSAHLHFDRKTGLLSFKRDRRSFLIIDGQHRVFGFNLASRSVRVPVVIYNKLSRAEECRLFMDINTKQRPVPAELLLDIRRLSETETAAEALLHDVFDLFASEEDSALAGLLSPSERRKGKISRVTFNAALKSIDDAFVDAKPREVYEVFNAYLAACVSGLRWHGAEANIANSALFKALTLLFTNVAERVSDRYSGAYTVKNFEEVLTPFFRRLKKSDLPRSGLGHLALYEYYRKALSAGFSLKQWLFA
jgi:DGQHR domain-containing protein